MRPIRTNPAVKSQSGSTVIRGVVLAGVLAGLLILVWQAGRSPEGSIRFVDQTTAAGIDFVHFGTNRHSLLPEDVGSGAGWGDYDQDGDEDLFLVNFAGRLLTSREAIGQRPGNKLYRNNGDGTFTDVSGQAGVGLGGWNNACLWMDYDGDGALDLVISHFEGLRLYRNEKDGTFRETTHAAGLGAIRRYLMGMTAADYDRDGDLDLYVCGYLKFDRERCKDRPMVSGRPAVWTNPVSYDAAENLLFQNNGNGTFTDVTKKAGVANPKGKSMHAVFCDLDNDGWPEIYVANDVSTPDALYHNKRDGTFEDVSGLAGTYDRRAGMGLAVADVWHRGWSDLLVTHWVAEDHALWKNQSGEFRDRTPLSFDDVTPHVGLIPKPSAHVGWGCGLYDFENDGFTDLFLVNGSTIEDELTAEVLSDPKLLPQIAELFRWQSDRDAFVEVGAQAGAFFREHHVSRGAAFADYDQDGRMDVLVIQHNEPAQLLRNESPSGNWLQVQAIGPPGNRYSIGARVRVRAGGQTQSREILCGSSYLGNDTFIAHFGLGTRARIDAVEVTFPDGTTRITNNVPVNQRIQMYFETTQKAP